MSAKKQSASKSKSKTAAKAAKTGGAENPSTDETVKSLVQNKRKNTPAVFKLPSRKQTPVVFSLDDVQEVLKQRKTLDAEEAETRPAGKKAAAKKAAAPKTTEESAATKKATHRRLAAASIADILGYAPSPERKKQKREEVEESQVPEKFRKYYRLLIGLRRHVRSEIDLHSSETLKRSSKDDSGDLSSYGQHMADAGTDNFDRDFALSLVSSEQEALFEIEEAIKRIFAGTYGICEQTGQPIAEERLEAVPFTRFSVEGQALHESGAKKKVQRGGVFAAVDKDDSLSFGEDDDND